MPANLLNNIDAIVHIGAGRGRELNEYLASSAQQIILVEPNPRLVTQLRRLGEADARIRVIDAAVSNSSEHNLLREYNLPNVNSLYRATGLIQLYPGLRELGQLPVSTLTGQELMNHCVLQGDNNLLIIEAPGSELAIIETLTEAGAIDKFSRLAINCAEDTLYDSPSHAGAVLKLLQEQGFDLVHRDDADPDWPSWVFQRNALKQQFTALTLQYKATTMELETARNELDELRIKSAVAQENLDARERERDAVRDELSVLTEQLEQAQDRQAIAEQRATDERQRALELEQELKLTSEDLAEHKTHLASHKQRLADTEEKLAQAQTQIAAQGQSSKRFDELEAKLAALGNNIVNEVDKKLLNTGKQLESFVGLQGYFQHGEVPLSYHGWPISPDLALFLVDKVESKNYDLIIEFGSGTSTALFAKAVLNRGLRARGRNEHLLDRQSGEKDLAFVQPSENDLPKRVISFEHNKEFYQKTQHLLQNGGLQKVVDLVHAPLVDYRFENEDYLYYDCDAVLSRIATMFEGRVAKILVLVDGPPAKTGPDARFPAVPKLMNRLATHQIDIVLDDYIRTEEKVIAERWCKLLDRRGVRYTKSVVNFEKGTFCLTVNE